MNPSDMPSPGELQPQGGWRTTEAQRLPVPSPRRRGPLFRAVSLLARAFGREQVPDLFAVLHVHRRLFWPWLLFASRLMPRGRLPARDRERIILRMAWNCRSRYEWGQHVEIALSIGMSDADILRVAQGPAACADPAGRALLQACDELHREQCVTPATWAALAARYEQKLLIEFLMLAGHYVMLAGFLNSAGLRLEPPVEEVLEAFQRRTALTASAPRSP
ncbi:MAG: carboxymuconolactone decarboxylase family protein [Nevskia sp.]|nr:carboxymuconolactone decarboxylase family protein [Nevskia sp.]